MKYGFDQPHYRWKPEDANHAECLPFKFKPHSVPNEHGDVPRAGCSCGFYAHGRRDASNSETTVSRVGGLVAGWGNLELHEKGFKCGVAKGDFTRLSRRFQRKLAKVNAAPQPTSAGSSRSSVSDPGPSSPPGRRSEILLAIRDRGRAKIPGLRCA